MGDRVCTEHAPRAPGEKAPEDMRETTGRADQAHMPCSRLQEKRKVGTRLWAALNTHHRIWVWYWFYPLTHPKHCRITATVKSSNIPHEMGDTNSPLMVKTLKHQDKIMLLYKICQTCVCLWYLTLEETDKLQSLLSFCAHMHAIRVFRVM